MRMIERGVVIRRLTDRRAAAETGAPAGNAPAHNRSTEWSWGIGMSVMPSRPYRISERASHTFIHGASSRSIWRGRPCSWPGAPRRGVHQRRRTSSCSRSSSAFMNRCSAGMYCERKLRWACRKWRWSRDATESILAVFLLMRCAARVCSLTARRSG